MPSRVVECRGVESTASQSVSSSSSTSRLCPCSRWAQLVACRPQPAPPPAASRLALINDCKVQNVTSPTEVGRKTRHLGSKHDHTLVATVLIRKIATRRVYASRGYSSGPLHSSDKSLQKPHHNTQTHSLSHSHRSPKHHHAPMPMPCYVPNLSNCSRSPCSPRPTSSRPSAQPRASPLEALRQELQLLQGSDRCASRESS